MENQYYTPGKESKYKLNNIENKTKLLNFAVALACQRIQF